MHQSLIQNTPETSPLIIDSLRAEIRDYSDILNIYGLKHTKVDYYFQVGSIEKIQGWLIHLSVIKTQVQDLLKTVIPIFIKENIPFKVVQDSETTRTLLDGSLGYYKIGKVITVYPDSDDQALMIAEKLITATNVFRGPDVLTDFQLGGIVFCRYGAFNPVVQSDEVGNKENFIYDKSGNLIKDVNLIPFSKPSWVDWPFDKIKKITDTVSKELPRHIYKPISVLKSDAKGSVIKVLYLKNLFQVKTCVLKQGRKNMWSDDYERDMIDRLRWQKRLYTLLKDENVMPKIYDLFIHIDDAYLLMEFINGRSLYDLILDLNKNCHSWEEIPYDDQLSIIDLITQLLSVVQKVHQKGFVHRDITPVNFLIDKKGRFFLIDNELCYSIDLKFPLPPFGFGTPGFMSLEQKKGITPTPKQDIYGLGATLLLIFSGLSPLVFDNMDRSTLQENLSLFVKNTALAEVISLCLDSEPINRPSLSNIQKVIYQFKKDLPSIKRAEQTSTTPNSSKLERILIDAIHGLAKPPILIVNDLWQSKAYSTENIIGIEKIEYAKSEGLHTGMTGVLYVLARARQMGFEITRSLTAYYKSWEYLKDNYIDNKSLRTPGFYSGLAGIALALKSGVESSLIEDNEASRLLIKQCLDMPNDCLDMANGSAGQLLSLLQCRQYLDGAFFKKMLDERFDNLLREQTKNGFWIVSAIKKLPLLGFSFGNTGVVYSLLSCYEHLKDTRIKHSILKSLDYLVDQASQVAKNFKEKGSRSLLNSQAEDGIIGITLTLIKAYEVLNEPEYKDCAEMILQGYPESIVHDNLYQHSGITGLGEVYLEAYRIFRNEKWRKRTHWIAALLTCICQHEEGNHAVWASGNSANITADLMTGNSGVIHFLLRYMYPDRLGLRLFS